MSRPVLVSLFVVVLATAGCLTAFDASTNGGVRRRPPPPGGTALTPPTETEKRTTGRSSAAGTSAGGPIARDPSSGEPVFPPGISKGGIENATVLLNAHTRTLERTGFVVNPTVTATIRETGLLAEGTTRGGARVAANETAYRAHRIDSAAPLQRRSQGWYNGATEHYRRVTEVGRIHERRSPGELAGRSLLAPHLSAGEFEVTAIDRRRTGTLLTLTGAGLTTD